MLARRRRADVVVERRLIRERRRRIRPFDLELSRGPDRIPLLIGDDAEEALVPHHLDGRDILDRAFVDADGNGAGNSGPDHSAMRHAGHFDVRAKIGLREHLSGDVVACNRLADDGVILGILRLCLAGSVKRIAVFAVPVEMDVEEPPADEIGVTDALRGVGRGVNNAVGHLKLFGGKAEPVGRHGDQDAPRLGGGHAHLLAALLNAGRARRAALVDAGRGVADENLGVIERHIKFFGDHLPYRRGQALSHIHLAEIGRDGAVAVDGEIGGQLIRCQRRLHRRGRRHLQPRGRNRNSAARRSRRRVRRRP